MLSDQQRLYNELNKEKRQEWDRKSHNNRYQRTAEQQRQKANDYYKSHRNEILLRRKKKYHKSQLEAYNLSPDRKAVARKFRQTLKGKFALYKSNAKVRGISFDISFREFESFWQKSCYYCGDTISTIGIDRIDSTKGYTLENLSPCCSPCNVSKNDETREAYIARCRRVAARHPEI